MNRTSKLLVTAASTVATMLAALPAAAQNSGSAMTANGAVAPTAAGDTGGNLLWVWVWILVVGIVVFVAGTSLAQPKGHRR